VTVHGRLPNLRRRTGTANEIASRVIDRDPGRGVGYCFQRIRVQTDHVALDDVPGSATGRAAKNDDPVAAIARDRVLHGREEAAYPSNGVVRRVFDQDAIGAIGNRAGAALVGSNSIALNPVVGNSTEDLDAALAIARN